MLLHDIGKASMRTTDANGVDHFKGHGPAGKEIAKKILRRLKFDNDTIAQVTHLIYWHDYRPAPEEKSGPAGDPQSGRRSVSAVFEGTAGG